MQGHCDFSVAYLHHFGLLNSPSPRCRKHLCCVKHFHSLSVVAVQFLRLFPSFSIPSNIAKVYIELAYSHIERSLK